MHSHRFLSEVIPPEGDDAMLPAGEARHIARVLRLRVGDEITLFDGRGVEATARIAAVTGAGVRALILARAVAAPDPGPAIHLLVPWLKQPQRLDWLIEKATELGATRLTITATPPERGSKRLERWQRLTTAAAKQAGRAHLMAIADDTASLPPVSDEVRILLSERDDAPPLREVLPPATPTSLALAVGPEQGFTDAEEIESVKQGWTRASLGPMRLRTETAAIAGLAAVRALLS